jgi:hypothetical protein
LEAFVTSLFLSRTLRRRSLAHLCAVALSCAVPAGALVATAAPAGATPVAHPAAVGYTRIAGATRIDTAIAASQDDFAAGAATAVVIARDDEFPDALSGGPLAANKGGPLLFLARHDRCVGADGDEAGAAGGVDGVHHGWHRGDADDDRVGDHWAWLRATAGCGFGPVRYCGGGGGCDG